MPPSRNRKSAYSIHEEEAGTHLEVDTVAGLNVRHPGGEEGRGHPGVAVLTAGDSGLPVAALARHPHLANSPV